MSLSRAQDDVEAFHTAIGQPLHTKPEFRDAGFRLRLLLEEVAEFAEASGFGYVALTVREVMRRADDTYADCIGRDLPAACDGLIDTIYIAIGTLAHWGVNAAPLWDAVQRANMAKAGGGRNAEGKAMKPPGWTPPNIEGELVKQGYKP